MEIFDEEEIEYGFCDEPMNKKRGRRPRQHAPAEPKVRGRRARQDSAATRIPVEFGADAPELRRLAAENKTSVSSLVAGMVSLWLQPEEK